DTVVEYRRLGPTGVQVSRVCLGTVYFGSGVPEAEATRIVHRAIDLGINFVDTAEIYQRPAFGAAEQALGRALRGRRHEVVLATQVRCNPCAFRPGTPAD